MASASQWIRTYGGGGTSNEAYSIQQTSDGGYVVAGYTVPFGASYMDAWVLKLDGKGKVQWQKTYGGTSNDVAQSIQQTSDGGYIVAGITQSFGVVFVAAWVFKLDANGNVQWQKTYGGGDLDRANSIQQTSDGGYVVAGWTSSFGAGGYDAWLFKLDANGNVQWQKAYGGTGDDFANSIQQTSDSGYVVAGWTSSFGAGYADAWLFKLDANGNVQWQKAYGGTGNDYAQSIQQTSDGEYVVAVKTGAFGAGWDAWVFKLDANGNVQWQTLDEMTDSIPYSIQQTTDSGYIVAGSAGWTLVTLKLDANGEILGCNAMGASSATVNNTNATTISTNVTGIDTNISPQTSTASVTNTNAVVTKICGPRISVSPSSLNFGALKIGNSSTPSVITIYNTGTDDLDISGMTLWDAVNYSLDLNGGTNPCGSTTPTIIPNGSCTVTVTFSPTSTGQKDTSLTVKSDDPHTPTLNVPLSGTGIPDVTCNFLPGGTQITKGGTLGFQATVTNNTVQSQTFLFATFVTTPGGNRYPASGWLLGPLSVSLNPSQSKSGYRSHAIPSGAQLGTYTYHGYVGNYGVGLYDECTFTFTVTQ